MSESEDDDQNDDKNQDAKTLAGLVVAIVLVALTVFLMMKLKDGTKLLDCIGVDDRISVALAARESGLALFRSAVTCDEMKSET